jgi:hypothetical protein
MDQTLSFILFFSAILIFAGLLFIVIALSKKGTSQLNVEKYRSDWLRIEQSLHQNDPASFQLSVLNADKLLDKALREKGISGETMGARMKQLQTTWSNANAVWGAHKLRNQIAHESTVGINHDMARRALAAFKQALKDVGAI